MIQDLNKIYLPVSESLCKYNTKVKYYGDDFVKITCFSKQIFNPNKLQVHKRFERDPEELMPLHGFKIVRDGCLPDEFIKNSGVFPIEEKCQKTKTEDKETRTDSVKRSKDKVFEIAYANDFKYFITLTLDKEKISRTDKKEITKALKNWLSNLVRRKNFKYVICPEYHADGESIHFHGLCSGDNLSVINSGKVFKGKPVYNLGNWGYGFSTVLELDNNKEFICKYVTKYITKGNEPILGKFYLSGGDLKREVRTEYSNLDYVDFEVDSKNEYEVLKNSLSVKYKTL